MIDEEVSAAVLVILLVAGVIVFSQFFTSRVVEPFSELGVLGPGMKIGDYPKTVLVNETFKLYLYIGNHEGHAVYYRVYIKTGSKGTFVNETVPADAPVVAFYEAILASGQNKTIPIELSLRKPMVNCRLIFEMWILNPETREFNYHGRWCQLWLNVTSPEI